MWSSSENSFDPEMKVQAGYGLATGFLVWNCELYRKEIANLVFNMIMTIQDSTHDSLNKNLKLEIAVYPMLS